MSTRFVTEPVTAADVASGFRCGQRDLDHFFAKHALANSQKGIGKTFVLRGDGPRVLGFYTLSMADVASDTVATVWAERLPRYPLPVALIGRLAVHEKAQRRGIGTVLVADAVRRILEAADHLGCIGVIVDAKDDAAIRFYARFGFAMVDSSGWPQRMFLPLMTVRAASQ